MLMTYQMSPLSCTHTFCRRFQRILFSYLFRHSYIVILFKSPGRLCPTELPRLFIEGTQITHVVSTKFLGMYIDQHLPWKEHIKIYSLKSLKIFVLYLVSLYSCHPKFENPLLSYLPQPHILQHSRPMVLNL